MSTQPGYSSRSRLGPLSGGPGRTGRGARGWPASATVLPSAASGRPPAEGGDVAPAVGGGRRRHDEEREGAELGVLEPVCVLGEPPIARAAEDGRELLPGRRVW